LTDLSNLSGQEAGTLGSYVVRAGQVERAIGLLNKAGIEPMLIKGMGLLGEIYEPQERPMQDIDLMVRQHHFDRAVSVLMEAGYFKREHPGREITWERMYHDELFPPADEHGVVVEVHRHFVQPERYRVDVDEVWSGALKQKWFKGTALIPSWEDHVIILATHHARHGHGFREDDVQNVKDVRRIIEIKDLDFDAVADKAIKWGCSQVAWLMLSSQEMNVPEPVLERLKPCRLRMRIIRRFLVYRDGIWVRRPLDAEWKEKISMFLLCMDDKRQIAGALGTWGKKRLSDAVFQIFMK